MQHEENLASHCWLGKGKGVMSQRMLAAPRNWECKQMDFLLIASRGMQPCDTLILAQGDLVQTSDLQDNKFVLF